MIFKQSGKQIRMSFTPTNWQTLLLWSLIAEGGQGWQKDRKWNGLKRQRDVLVENGFITAEKKRGAFLLEVTAKGWGWAAGNLDAELPRSENAAQVFSSFLVRLGAVLEQRKLGFQELLKADLSEKEGVDVTAEPTDIKGKIRVAYYQLTRGKDKERVRLCRLRALLPDIASGELDQALLEMECGEDLVLYTLDNVKEITEEDRKAALNTGFGDPRYILYLGV